MTEDLRAAVEALADEWVAEYHQIADEGYPPISALRTHAAQLRALLATPAPEAARGDVVERYAEAIHGAMWGLNLLPGMTTMGVHHHTTDPAEHAAQRQFVRNALTYALNVTGLAPAPDLPTTVQADRDAEYQPCSHECNGCPTCDLEDDDTDDYESVGPWGPVVATPVSSFETSTLSVQADRDAGQVRLSENEKEALHPPTVCDCDDTIHCPTLAPIFDVVEHILSVWLAEVTAQRDVARSDDDRNSAKALAYYEQMEREKARADTAEAALAARQSDPDATERVEWGVRLPSGRVIPRRDRGWATRREAEIEAGVWQGETKILRRTVTTGEWTEVGE